MPRLRSLPALEVVWTLLPIRSGPLPVVCWAYIGSSTSNRQIRYVHLGDN
jgi:hypothetical protein